MRIRILTTLLLSLFLTACGAEETVTRELPSATSEATATPTPVSAPTPTPVPTPVPTAFSSYTIPPGAAVPVYAGPGTNHGYARDVGQDGVYTIVEEAQDSDGCLWGRLKSGVGWVKLGDTVEEDGIPPFTVDFALPELLASGDFARCNVDDGEYSIKLMILPHETLRDVRFELLVYGESGYAVDCTYDSFPELSAAWPLVADVVFYGDMTTYGLSFTDEQGALRRFAIGMSGRDGSLFAEEY